MLTYQDLLEAGQDEIKKGEFCLTAINSFRSSKEYSEAVAGEAYYNKHNLTIERFQKYLYTISGNKVPDLFSANYKLKTLFFRRLCMQQIQYVLGNGIKLDDTANKLKLGSDFDFKLQSLAKRAMAGGVGFGFWNYDHLEVFGYCDTPSEPGFCPLYSEETAELSAGIRYWFKTVGNKKLTRFTLYEADGFTEYSQLSGEDVVVVAQKQAYKRTTVSSPAGGVEAVIGENYGVLPIIPMYANDAHETELNGIREVIDCYDYIKSGMGNDIDNAGFYWVLKNSGGMDDQDLAQFVQRMKTVRATVVEGDDMGVEAHTLDIPIDARTKMLEILRKDLYEDFQALDVNTLSAAAKTTQEIQAAYQAQDNKCADFEYYILDFVQKILAIAGIDDNPTVNWNRVVNQSEQTDMILAAANYITPECVIQHLPFLTPEEAAEEIKRYQDEQVARFNAPQFVQPDETEEE